jgi:hypothetical protein
MERPPPPSTLFTERELLLIRLTRKKREATLRHDCSESTLPIGKQVHFPALLMTLKGKDLEKDTVEKCTLEEIE